MELQIWCALFLGWTVFHQNVARWKSFPRLSFPYAQWAAVLNCWVWLGTVHQNTNTGLLKLKVHEHALPATSKHLSLQAYCLVMCAHACRGVEGCVRTQLRCLFGQAGRRTGKWTKSLTRTQGTYAVFLAQHQVSCMTLYKSLILSCASVVLPC